MEKPTEATAAPTEPATEAPTEEMTAPPTEAPTDAPTEPPTEAPTEPPQPESFVLTFVGDCTFGCNKGRENAESAFPKTVGDDYGYPFRNVLAYFTEDDCSFANLEGVLGDQGKPLSGKKYTFRGTGDYTKILTENSVDAVTLANNHSGDYGTEGYEETKRLLDEAKVHYVEDMTCLLMGTERGLTIALYAAEQSQGKNDQERIIADIREIKEAGYADLIVCAFHWGRENKFRNNEVQQQLGHAAIDAGADIIWGHHPHVLQPIEEYNGGIIFYSLGNFAFGGNSAPKDLDTALVQQEVIREVDGSIRLGQLTIVPCSVNSAGSSNNYQPTPYQVGSDKYNRVLSKLDGSYQGKDLTIGYD